MLHYNKKRFQFFGHITLTLLFVSLLFGMSFTIAHASTRPKAFIFLPGFNTHSVSSDPTVIPDGFNAIKTGLNTKYPGSLFLAYSYKGYGKSYGELDTIQTLDTDYQALNEYMTNPVLQGKDIYLIGHSKGGSLAEYYDAVYYFDSLYQSAYNSRLAGVISLDSPNNGVSQHEPCFPSYISGFASIIGTSNMPILGDLTPGGFTVKSIQLAGNNAPALSLGSKDDCFLTTTDPPSAAGDTFLATGDNRVVESGGTGVDTHGKILNDPNAISILLNWIASHDSGSTNGTTPTPTSTTSTSPTTTTTSTPPCTASGSGVTLFVDANYGGNCHTFGVGEYSDLSQFGLDQNVSSLQDSNGAYHITFFDQKGLTGTPGYYDSDTSQLTGYWNDRARSMRVELHASPCSASGNGVTLFVDANYGGNCHTFGVGSYSDLSQFGLDQNVSSLQDTNGAYHITLYDQKGLTGTPGYYDADTSQLTGYWDNRARSMRVEMHRPTSCNTGTDGIAAYLNNDYQNGCIFITGDIPDLTTLNFDHIMASIRFVGSYVNTKQLAIYRQANYQDLCGTYSLDQSDLRNCAGVAMSVQVQPFTPPQQAQNLAQSAILDHPNSGNAVDNNLSTEWIGGHSVPLGLVFASPVTIQDIVVFDRAQSSTDNNQINKLQLVFSDGTVINNIDMTSGGPRCADVAFPAKQVSWVNVVPTDASGNNGFREIQIWDTSGAVYSQNNCVMKFSMTPISGSGPAPLIQPPTPTPSVTPTPSPTSTPSPTPTAACPSGWTCADIGGPNLTGSESLSNGTWTVQGSGGDIWGTADQFHYDWQTLSGDGSVSAQILSQTNTDGWAKSGVMFRQDNTPGSAFYMVALTPGNGITVQYRTDQGVNAQMNAQISGSSPVYLQTTRKGNTFTAATSADGVTWTTISGSTATLTINGKALAGLAIASHSASLATVTLNSVSITLATPTSTPTPSPTPTSSCPAGWTCADIGSPNLSGNESLSNGTWTVQGSGGDIWNASDQFHYDWQTLPGDGSINAQILSQTNTDGWAKSGVMFRQDNTPGSAFYMVALTPGNGVIVQYRTDQGVNAQMNAQISGTAPIYIKAIRTGNTFTAATSSDGVTWTTISGSSATLNVNGTVLVGLEVSSHSASLGTVTFNNVSITTGTSPTPTPSPSPTQTTPTPTATTSPSPTSTGVELLTAPWHLTGNNGASELYQSVASNALNGMTQVRITYNLHGLQALGGDASAIIIDQGGWHYISLANYGQNGLDGNQTVTIPISAFGLNLTQAIDGTIHTRFWYGSQFTVDIISIQLLP